MAYSRVETFASTHGFPNLSSFAQNLDVSTINSYKSTNISVASDIKSVLDVLKDEINSIISSNWKNKSGIKTKDVVENIIDGLTRVNTSMNTTFVNLLTKCSSLCDFLGKIENQLTELSTTSKTIMKKVTDENGEEKEESIDNPYYTNLERAITDNCKTADQNILSLESSINSEELQIVNNISSGESLPVAIMADFSNMTLDFVEPDSVVSLSPEEVPTKEETPEEVPPEDVPSEEEPMKSMSLNELRKMQSEVYNLFKNLGIDAESDFSSPEVKEFIKKAKEYEQSVYAAYENGELHYATMQALLSTLTDMETNGTKNNALYHKMWDSKLGYTDAGDIVWTSERGIRANMVFYDRIKNFKDHPEWLGDHSYEDVFNSNASYDEIVKNLKESTDEGNQNFYALQAFISIKNDLYNGYISTEEAMQRTKDVGDNSYIWDPKTQFTNRTVLGSVYQALCGDKIIGLEVEEEAIIPQMEKYQNAANNLEYND